jgi:micrococcal nuclease
MYDYKIKKVIRVIDGDTVDLELDLGFNLSLTQRIRLADIDAPEIRSKDLEEKKKGIESKEWLEEYFNQFKDEDIIVKTVKGDKYGRVLGWIYVVGEPNTINERMINEGLAKPFMVIKK